MGSTFISAIHKSSGKTIISIGLTAAFADKGLSVQTFNITLFSFIFALLIRYLFLIYNHKKLIS